MPNLRQQIREYFDARTLPAQRVEEILRAGREPDGGGGERKVVMFPRWPRLLALAAVLMIVAGLAFVMIPGRTARVPFAALAPRVIEFFGAAPQLPKISQDRAELRAWLLAHGAPAAFAVPARLAALESYACSVVDVQGRPAYLTCFWRKKNLDGSGGELIHLLAVRRSDFREAPAGAEPQTRELDGWSFASWTEGEVTYTLAAAAPLDQVRAFLAAGRSGRAGLVLAWVSF